MPTIQTILKKYRGNRGSLISVLQEAQESYGYLPGPVLEQVAVGMDIPLSEVYGVATFYSQFHLEKRGWNTIRVCRGTACHVKGGRGILRAIEQELGITPGETTPDYKFTLETVACLGACFLAPVMMINRDYFGRLTPQKAVNVLKQYE